jgi:dipeptidyl aminopeptidase/acylaminoacyl peptidase
MPMPHTSLRLLPRSLLMALAASLVACSSPPSTTRDESGATLQPNPNLLVQGIPPLPARLAEDVARYTDFRGHSFADWHPTRREMLIAHRKAGGNTAQLFLLRGPMAEPEQLTDSADPVSSGSFEPREGRYIVFERSSGGNEAAQLYRLDPATRTETLLTDPAERHDLQGWLHRSSTMVVASVPLDKTAQGGRRAQVTTSFRLVDPLNPQAARKIAELEGGGWWVGGIARDDSRLLLTRYLSANETQTWLLDIAGGKVAQVLPAGNRREQATYTAAGFTPDGSAIDVVSDKAGEFRELVRVRLASGEQRRVTAHIPWDMSGGTVTEDGSLIAVQANVEGRDELRFFDGRTLEERRMPALPAGSVGAAHFHRRLGELAFSINSARGPSQLFTLDPASGRVEQWTRAIAPAGIDMSRFTEQQIIRWPSFDGRSISGLMNLPGPAWKGKRPVLVMIHGGPEGQARIGFLNRYNYLIDELGIAIIQPNVRGSEGFGKTFLTLDNGRLREDSVKDIGALLDWIKTQPQLDASRVMVMGGSYGGYMSLAVSTHYADRIAGAVDIVGISNFVTFLNNTESYRRDLRRVEYGDERDPEMRAFLERISPLTNADRIKKPLFVVQGKNDPRVPYTEAEQIVARLRENKVPVWYLRAENEGHGFARKENADFQFYATLQFIRENLLK